MTDRAQQRDRAGGARDSGTDAQRRRRPIAFGLHQAFEYLVAVALVVLSVHIGGSTLLLGAGAVLGVLALTARGPLGLIRICGPRLHASLDVIAGVLLALSPLVPHLRPGVVGIVAVEIVALAWLRVTMLTRYAVGADEPPVVGRATARSAATTGSALAAIRSAGRLTAGARRRLPEAQTAFDSGARRIGGQAGRLQRAWRRAGR